jgi:hypothetical protein
MSTGGSFLASAEALKGLHPQGAPFLGATASGATLFLGFPGPPCGPEPSGGGPWALPAATLCIRSADGACRSAERGCKNHYAPVTAGAGNSDPERHHVRSPEVRSAEGEYRAAREQFMSSRRATCRQRGKPHQLRRPEALTVAKVRPPTRPQGFSACASVGCTYGSSLTLS